MPTAFVPDWVVDVAVVVIDLGGERAFGSDRGRHLVRRRNAVFNLNGERFRAAVVGRRLAAGRCPGDEIHGHVVERRAVLCGRR